MRHRSQSQRKNQRQGSRDPAQTGKQPGQQKDINHAGQRNLPVHSGSGRQNLTDLFPVSFLLLCASSRTKRIAATVFPERDCPVKHPCMISSLLMRYS